MDYISLTFLLHNSRWLNLVSNLTCLLTESLSILTKSNRTVRFSQES